MREVDQALARVYGTRSTPTDHPNHPPAPHFPLEPPARPAQAAAPSGVSLKWPATVLTLERDHGARFERLAGMLTETRESRQIKVLHFTSCHRAEGRTTLVLTLARCLARRPGRTLIVDADLTGPMLARQLGLTPRIGLDDVIEDNASAAEACLEALDDHLAILPLRTAVARPRDFLASPAWSCLMAKLRREYDLVLLDGSPLFSGLSAAVLHRSVDAAILVHNRSITGERALLRACEVLDAGGVPLLGLAETFV
jgi:Mrp family chromosome partitioning ATPase